MTYRPVMVFTAPSFQPAEFRQLLNDAQGGDPDTDALATVQQLNAAVAALEATIAALTDRVAALEEAAS